MSTSFTLADLHAIERAIASGSLVVRYSDKSVTYRSIDELLKARGVIAQALGLAGSTKRVFMEHEKGTDCS